MVGLQQPLFLQAVKSLFCNSLLKPRFSTTLLCFVRACVSPSHAISLGYTAEEDRRRIGLDRQVRSRGVLKTVATMPFNLVRGGVALVAGGVGDGGPLSPRTPVSPAGDGLADQWIDFLIEQAERDGAAAATGGNSLAAAGAQAGSAAPASGSAMMSGEISMGAAQAELLERMAAAQTSDGSAHAATSPETLPRMQSAA